MSDPKRKRLSFRRIRLRHRLGALTPPRDGVEELDQGKLTPLLRLKYHGSISDAVADLGKPEEIGRVFAGFQKYLYRQEIAA